MHPRLSAHASASWGQPAVPSSIAGVQDAQWLLARFSPIAGGVDAIALGAHAAPLCGIWFALLMFCGRAAESESEGSWRVRRRMWLAIGVLVTVAVVGGFALGSRGRAADAPLGGAANGARALPASAEAPVAVDVLASAPDKYLGEVRVSGSVTSVDSAAHTLVLGCSDACVAVPVQYSGALPKKGAQVVVSGTITKNATGKYVFDASDVSSAR